MLLRYGSTRNPRAASAARTRATSKITAVQFLTATNDVFETEGKHYITIFVTAEIAEDSEIKEPKVMEPEKCRGWEWSSWDELERSANGQGGRELFLPMINLIKQRPGVVPSF